LIGGRKGEAKERSIKWEGGREGRRERGGRWGWGGFGLSSVGGVNWVVG